MLHFLPGYDSLVNQDIYFIITHLQDSLYFTKIVITLSKTGHFYLTFDTTWGTFIANCQKEGCSHLPGVGRLRFNMNMQIKAMIEKIKIKKMY